MTLQLTASEEFDEGHLKDDVFQAANDIIQTLSVLDDNHPGISRDTDPMSHAFQVSWHSLRKVSILAIPQGIILTTEPREPRRDCNIVTSNVGGLFASTLWKYRLFIKRLIANNPEDMKHYMLGVLRQVRARQFDVAELSVHDYLDFR